MATGHSHGRGKVIVQLAHLLSSQLPRGALRFTFPRKTVLVSSAPALLHHGFSWQPLSDLTWNYRVAAGSEVTYHERSSSVKPPIHSHSKYSNMCEPVYGLRPALPPRLSFSSNFPPFPSTASSGLLHSERTQPFSSDAAQTSGEQGSSKEESGRGGDGGANIGGRGGWFSRLKNVFTKTEAAEEVVLTLDQFADQLRQARQFGSLAEFGRGLPRGGEEVVKRSLEQQEAVVRAMTREEKDNLELFTEKSRARVAQECSCTLTAVNDVILKYRWYESANHKMQKLKREGKPLPRTFEEVEKVVGSPKPSSQSPGGGVGSKISRNALCPCGSKKKYKRVQVATFVEPDDGQLRFEVELEFVQLLANPAYIHHLAQNEFFEDPAFLGYLKYLQYWKGPEYVKYIMYPHALFFLDQLQGAKFRAAMAHPHNKEMVHRQQFYFWLHYRSNRLKVLQDQATVVTQASVGEGGEGDAGGVLEEEMPPTTPQLLPSAQPPLRIKREGGTIEKSNLEGSRKRKAD